MNWCSKIVAMYTHAVLFELPNIPNLLQLLVRDRWRLSFYYDRYTIRDGMFLTNQPKSGQFKREDRLKISSFCKSKSWGSQQLRDAEELHDGSRACTHFKNWCAGVKRHVALPPDMSGGGGSKRLRIARAPARAAPRDKGQRRGAGLACLVCAECGRLRGTRHLPD